MENYENLSSVSKNDERFGFLQTGKFYVARRGGLLLMALAAAGVAAEMWFVDFMVRMLITETVTYSHIFIIAAASLIAGAVLFLICGTVISVIAKGKVCEYRADDVRFTTTVSGRQQTVYYSQVTGVLFEPIDFLGKTRGYKVTVMADKQTSFVYKLVFGGRRQFTVPEATPFHIIRERAGLLRPKIAPPPVQTANMERFSAEGTQRFAPRDESEKSGEAFFNTETDETAVLACGSFNVPYKLDKVFRGIILAVLVFLAICVLSQIQSLLAALFGDLMSLLKILLVLGFILLSLGTAFNVLSSGRRVKYSLNSIELSVVDTKNGRSDIYLCDLKAVRYKYFYTFFVIKRGYTFEIVTKYRVYRYRFLFPYGKKDVRLEAAPFYPLRDFVSAETTEEVKASLGRSDKETPFAKRNEWSYL